MPPRQSRPDSNSCWQIDLTFIDCACKSLLRFEDFLGGLDYGLEGCWRCKENALELMNWLVGKEIWHPSKHFLAGSRAPASMHKEAGCFECAQYMTTNSSIHRRDHTNRAALEGALGTLDAFGPNFQDPETEMRTRWPLLLLAQTQNFQDWDLFLHFFGGSPAPAYEFTLPGLRLNPKKLG